MARTLENSKFTTICTDVPVTPPIEMYGGTQVYGGAALTGAVAITRLFEVDVPVGWAAGRQAGWISAFSWRDLVGTWEEWAQHAFRDQPSCEILRDGEEVTSIYATYDDSTYESLHVFTYDEL